jgi:hypothetical protein
MNRVVIASEILKIAKELMAIEFPTQDALDKYLKDHPGADRSFHQVRQKSELKPHSKPVPLRPSFPWQAHPLKRPNMIYERRKRTPSSYMR